MAHDHPLSYTKEKERPYPHMATKGARRGQRVTQISACTFDDEFFSISSCLLQHLLKKIARAEHNLIGIVHATVQSSNNVIGASGWKHQDLGFDESARSLPIGLSTYSKEAGASCGCAQLLRGWDLEKLFECLSMKSGHGQITNIRGEPMRSCPYIRNYPWIVLIFLLRPGA